MIVLNSTVPLAFVVGVGVAWCDAARGRIGRMWSFISRGCQTTDLAGAFFDAAAARASRHRHNFHLTSYTSM